MTKIRLIFFIITLLVTGIVGTLAIMYAKGYRFNPENSKIQPIGLFVAKSDPDGAQIYIDGKLKTATYSTINLKTGNYDVEIRKDGYKSWKKRIGIEQEVVTEITANLFKSAPSLTALTFTAVVNPTSSGDFTKIAYYVPASKENLEDDKEGLWLIETLDLPLGFSQEPRRITDGNPDNSSWEFSPNNQEILLQTPTGVFLLETSLFTPQAKRVNISSTFSSILKKWDIDKKLKLETKVKRLPDELKELLLAKSAKVLFSPDGDKILYEAKADFELSDNLIPQLPGSSTQEQNRSIKTGKIYTYDIKEDRNFLIATKEIAGDEECPKTNAILISCSSSIVWYPTSLNLLVNKVDSVVIVDYDATNSQEVFAGSYVAPLAFPTTSDDRIIMLTNLGANSSSSNLYSLSVK